MTYPAAQPGFSGTYNAAQFALLNPATYIGQTVHVDANNRLEQYYSDGSTWTPRTGSPILLSADRVIAVTDNGSTFACTTALTITLPLGLSPRPSFIVDCPPTGNVTFATSGGALINGATTSLTRARAANPAGVAVLTHQDADSYGVSGS